MCHEDGDFLSLAGSPLVQSETTPSEYPTIDSGDTLLHRSCTTPSCIPHQLELHIDEDVCSAPASSESSSAVISPFGDPQHSQMLNDGGSFSEISHVESLSFCNTTKSPSLTEDNSQTHMSAINVSAGKPLSPLEKMPSPVSVGRTSSPVPTTKGYSSASNSKSPIPVSGFPSPTLGVNSPSPSDFKCSSPSRSDKSPSLCRKSDASPSPDTKTVYPVTVPRLSSPVPKCVSPVIVPNSSSPVAFPKSASPETILKGGSPENVSKSSSPVSIPRLSSPVSKFASDAPNISSSAIMPKSPALITRKTYTLQGTDSPRASPVQPFVTSDRPSSQGGEMVDLTWPCREPLLDDTLDKLLLPDSTQLSYNQLPATYLPGDEDRSWEEEDGMYPDLSQEGTLTPMTESSWLDECFTPSTCPGTPDAALDLPIQQPPAVERLSASGQVGCSH